MKLNKLRYDGKSNKRPFSFALRRYELIMRDLNQRALATAFTIAVRSAQIVPPKNDLRYVMKISIRTDQ